MSRNDNPFNSSPSSSPYEYRGANSRSGIVLGTSSEAMMGGPAKPSYSSSATTSAPPITSNSAPLTFTPINSLGVRQRVQGNSSTSDLITGFKTLLPGPLAPDPSTREVEVLVNLMDIRKAEAASRSDGGSCRGTAISNSNSPGAQKTFIHSVSGLRFVELDIDLERSPTYTPKEQSAKNIKHHVIRGTIVGFYFPGMPSLSREASGAGCLEAMPGRVVIFQPRGVELCSPVDLTKARALTAIRCKHCQGIVPADESAYHMEWAHPERMLPQTQVVASPTPSQNSPAFSPPPSAPPQQAAASPQQQPYDPFTDNATQQASPPRQVPMFQQPQYPGAPPPLHQTQQPAVASPPPQQYRYVPEPNQQYQYQPAQPQVQYNQFQQQQQPRQQQQLQQPAYEYRPPAQAQAQAQAQPAPQAGNANHGFIPFGATQGTTYNNNNNFGYNNTTNSNSSLTFGSSGNNSSFGGGQRSYTVTYMWGGRTLKLERTSLEVFGDHSYFQSLLRSKKLGEGAQGSVSLCETPDGKQLVIKDLEFERPEDAQACFKQSMRFTSLKHVHLISYLAGERGSQYDVTGSKQTHYVSILMPYYPDGDVQKLVQHGSRLSWLAISSLGLQIATALEYLHKLPTPVVHGDIKPDNVLLYSNKEQCVLMDLDTARECERPLMSSVSQSYMTRGGNGGGGNGNGGFSFDEWVGPKGQQPPPPAAELQGTMEWMAPEVAAGKPITTASDIWSLGLVLFAMVALPEFMMFENPRTRQTCILNDKDWTNDALWWVLNRHLEAARCPKVLRDVILQMVNINPSARPSATNVIPGLEYASENILLGILT